MALTRRCRTRRSGPTPGGPGSTPGGPGSTPGGPGSTPGGPGSTPGGPGPRPEAEHATAGPVPVGDAGIAEYDAALPGDLPDPQPQLFFGDDDQWGYGRATEWRTVSGGYASTTGAADVWTRVRIPLIAGRPLDGLARFAIVADSANGLSAPLSFREWLFIPPGVTMHLHRYPAGEWVRLTANSDPGRDGIGLTDGALSDATGRCGTVTQPLLVTPRWARFPRPRWPDSEGAPGLIPGRAGLIPGVRARRGRPDCSTGQSPGRARRKPRIARRDVPGDIWRIPGRCGLEMKRRPIGVPATLGPPDPGPTRRPG